MEFIPVVDTVSVELRQTLFGQNCENTLYFRRIDGNINSGTMEALSDDLQEWYGGGVVALASFETLFREIYVTDLTTSTSPTFTRTVSPPVAGASTSNAEPGNVSLAISFRTANRGRSGRGRNYFIGLPANARTGNTANSGFVTSLSAEYNSIVGIGGLSDGWEWVVVSRFSNGSPRATGLIQSVVSAIVVDGSLDSQRRRLTGRGN